MPDPLVTVEELARLDPAPALADVRWYLAEPERGRQEHEAGHIPNAAYIDLDSHLSAPDGPGRHPLPTRKHFAETMGALGFGDDDLIVTYDDSGGAIAARLWWMLRDIGHDRVQVLDGGIAAWRSAAQPIDSSSTRRPTVTMTVRQSATRQLDRDGLRSRLGTVTLLDARAPERYRGEEEPIDPIAGHIPTALSASMAENLAKDKIFLDAARLRERFTRLGVDADRDTVLYCGSGVTACHNALAMVRAGLPEPILYPGSWSDWCTSGGEVVTGSEPGSV